MAEIEKVFSSIQEGYQRLKAAKIGIPDRVPVYAQMHEFVMKESGLSPLRFYTDPEIFVTSTLEVMEKYGFDTPYLDWDGYNIEPEALGQKVIYANQGVPELDRSQPFIRDKKDLKKIKTPDFDSDGRFPFVIKIHQIFREMTGGAEPDLRVCAPFTMAANFRGISNLIIDIYDDLEFVEKLLELIVEKVLTSWILRLKKEFPKVTGISVDDAMGSLPIVNLEIIKKLIIPNILRLRELCGPEIYVPNWVGESYLKAPAQLLQLKLKACPGFVVGQDPDVEILGPLLYKELAEKRNIPLVLGIGAKFLEKSTATQIIERIRHYIDIGGKDGQLILYLCNLTALTPPENVTVAVEAIKKYGTY